MCYSGKCPYEDYWGDCTIKNGRYPEDALCVREQERDDKEDGSFEGE